MREIDADDLLARGAIRRGQEPKHCGKSMVYVDSGIWECVGCDVYVQVVNGHAEWKSGS